MRHGVFGRKLSRTKNERRRLFAGLLRDLILHGSITTTYAKAKSVQPTIDKLITKAKQNTEQKKRELFAMLTDKAIVAKLVERAGGQFASRKSGYTQILKTDFRRGDNAQSVLFRFIDPEVQVVPVSNAKEITEVNPKNKDSRKNSEKTQKSSPRKTGSKK